MRVAHLSTTGLTCGIGEYARKVVQIYQQHGIANLLLTGREANAEPNFENMNWPARIGWFYDTADMKRSQILPEALQYLRDFDATHLIVHYHGGFFPPEVLLDFAVQVMRHGTLIVVVVHNFTENCAAAMRRLNDLGVTLFSHRLTEVVQARAVGVDLVPIPLGIDAGQFLTNRADTPRDFEARPPRIVTTGFLRKHKGAVTLINAMEAVVRHFPAAYLKIQCALYPSNDSIAELIDCQKETSRLGLEKNITLDIRFLDREDLLAELAKADLAVLPYSSSNEGGSATAADCLAVGLPLIVSDAEIFDELRDVALTVPPEAPRVGEAILCVLSDPGLYSSLAERSLSFAHSNAWESIAGAFLATAGSAANLPNN
jgi:glycosyltransferase involved in cell wall biosynthesis